MKNWQKGKSLPEKLRKEPTTSAEPSNGCAPSLALRKTVTVTKLTLHGSGALLGPEVRGGHSTPRCTDWMPLEQQLVNWPIRLRAFGVKVISMS